MIHDLGHLIKLVWHAGQAVLDVYHQGDITVVSKADNSPVTLADKASHQVLSKGLTAYDNRPILSEESEQPPWSVRQQWREYWLIDPLDGTREFIKGNGEFTINLALILDGEPVFGIVYVPVTDMFFYGGRGSGAFRQRGLTGRAEVIRCADYPPVEGVWRVLGSRSHTSAQFDSFLSQLPRFQLTAVGSSLKLCMVAEGSADLYPRFGPTCEWDTAAGQAVLEAAGGQLLSTDNLMPLRYNTKESLLNPSFIACAGVSWAWGSWHRQGDSPVSRER